ncbi:Glutathione transferase [Pyrenophora tritici-repentis]|nr:Glutathione transferase [Pyrenophora tritici-repentis]KAG9376009.1 Glutathione transferase [Pyrenophora tritici-repentis]
MLTDVLDNRLALRNHNVLVCACGPDAHRGRFSQRVDGFEFGARALVGVALVDGDVVG